MTQPKTRAAVYVRVSTAEQANEGLSLEEQERRTTEYVERQGWQLVRVYREAGVSGRREDRPELNRLLDSLDSIDALVIFKLDRLGRSNRHLLELYARLESAGVQLVSLSENLDTTTPSGKLLRSMLSSMAEFEADTISERVRSVTVARAKRGRHHGGPRMYGYQHRDGELVVVTDEALIVRRIFDRYLAGHSQHRIARDLNADKVPALKTRWTQSMISGILRSPVYGGRVRLNGVTYDGTHDAIVSDETWEKVAQLRAATTRTKDAGRGKPSKRFLLTRGHLRCGCGASMVVRSDADRYECSARKADVRACSQPPIKRDRVDGALLSYFLTCGVDLDATRAQLTDAVARRLAEVRSLREQAERQEHQTAESLARIRREYKTGELTAADWRDFRDELTAEQAAAGAEAGRLRKQEQEVAESNELRDCESDTLAQLAELRASIAREVMEARGLEAVRSALSRLFVSFTLTPADAAAPETDAVLDAVDLDPDYVLWAEPGATALQGIDENWLPILKRVALHGDWQNEREGLTT